MDNNANQDFDNPDIKVLINKTQPILIDEHQFKAIAAKCYNFSEQDVEQNFQEQFHEHFTDFQNYQDMARAYLNNNPDLQNLLQDCSTEGERNELINQFEDRFLRYVLHVAEVDGHVKLNRVPAQKLKLSLRTALECMRLCEPITRQVSFDVSNWSVEQISKFLSYAKDNMLLSRIALIGSRENIKRAYVLMEQEERQAQASKSGNILAPIGIVPIKNGSANAADHKIEVALEVRHPKQEVVEDLQQQKSYQNIIHYQAPGGNGKPGWDLYIGRLDTHGEKADSKIYVFQKGNPYCKLLASVDAGDYDLRHPDQIEELVSNLEQEGKLKTAPEAPITAEERNIFRELLQQHVRAKLNTDCGYELGGGNLEVLYSLYMLPLDADQKEARQQAEMQEQHILYVNQNSGMLFEGCKDKAAAFAKLGLKESDFGRTEPPKFKVCQVSSGGHIVSLVIRLDRSFKEATDEKSKLPTVYLLDSSNVIAKKKKEVFGPLAKDMVSLDITASEDVPSNSLNGYQRNGTCWLHGIASVSAISAMPDDDVLNYLEHQESWPIFSLKAMQEMEKRFSDQAVGPQAVWPVKQDDARYNHHTISVGLEERKQYELENRYYIQDQYLQNCNNRLQKLHQQIQEEIKSHKQKIKELKDKSGDAVQAQLLGYQQKLTEAEERLARVKASQKEFDDYLKQRQQNDKSRLAPQKETPVKTTRDALPEKLPNNQNPYRDTQPNKKITNNKTTDSEKQKEEEEREELKEKRSLEQSKTDQVVRNSPMPRSSYRHDYLRL